jgi:SAM-dependent methyltransferase/uncharacterized coiled-coil DUF342 family protein
MPEEKILHQQGIEQEHKKDVREDSERTQLPSIVPTLKQIANNHTGKLSDKWEAYYDVYGSIFSEYRKEPVSVLEIGIQNGGFLEILSLYFWNAKAIVGCDIDPKCGELKYTDNKIHIVLGDIKDKNNVERILKISDTYDIIIDDGSHTHEDIIKAFINLFPHLKDGGIYIIEDLHASYWKSYEGGVFNPTTAINFFKRLMDILNHEAWGVGIQRKEVLKPLLEYYQVDIDEVDLAHIRSIEVYNSMIVIKKDSPDKVYLKRRLIVGNHESITKGFLKLKGTQIRDLVNDLQVDFDRDKDPLILIKTIEQKNQGLHTLASQISNLQKEKDELSQKTEFLTQSLDQREQELRDLITQLEQRNKLYEELSVQLAQKEQQLQNYSSQLETLQKEKDELSQKTEFLTQSLDQREQELRDLITQLEQRNKLYEETLKEKEQLVTDLAEKTQTIEYLNHVVVSKEQQLQNYSSQLETLQKEKDDLTQKTEFLTQSLDQREQELRDLIPQLEQRNKLYEELINQNESLKNQINNKDDIIEKLSKEKGELFITLMEIKNSTHWKLVGKPILKLQKLFGKNRKK